MVESLTYQDNGSLAMIDNFSCKLFHTDVTQVSLMCPNELILRHAPAFKYPPILEENIGYTKKQLGLVFPV